jgi:hypothetical protein
MRVKNVKIFKKGKIKGRKVYEYMGDIGVSEGIVFSGREGGGA